MSGFFRGTSTEQSNWSNTDKKLMKSMKTPKIFKTKVNMKKVNKDIMSRWTTEKITELLGFEDEIVIGLCINHLMSEKPLEPKAIQVALTGFLEKDCPKFMEELWTLLVSAQSTSSGIPQLFLDRKKQELRAKKEAEDARRGREASHGDTRKRSRWGEQPEGAAAAPAATHQTGNSHAPNTSSNGGSVGQREDDQRDVEPKRSRSRERQKDRRDNRGRRSRSGGRSDRDKNKDREPRNRSPDRGGRRSRSRERGRERRDDRRRSRTPERRRGSDRRDDRRGDRRESYRRDDRRGCGRRSRERRSRSRERRSRSKEVDDLGRDQNQDHNRNEGRGGDRGKDRDEIPRGETNDRKGEEKELQLKQMLMAKVQRKMGEGTGAEGADDKGQSPKQGNQQNK
jgi:serine/arginine repetitive matrix protein 1